MIALIQAGGAGTRLKSITGDSLPKPMVLINGKPILEHQIDSLKASDVKDIVIVISKNGGPIENYFGDGTKFGVRISYIKEEEPLGTAGALSLFKKRFNEDFILLFGDLMLDIDFTRFVAFHKEKKAMISAFAHPNSHPFDSDLLLSDSDDRITGVDSKHNVRDYYYENLVNAGVYVVSKEVLSSVPSPIKLDFEKDVLSLYVKKGEAYAYRSSEYVKDCGTPERYLSVNEDSKNGIVSMKNLRNKQRCIFLDRDGTINKFGDFVTSSDKLFLNPDAAKAIKLINESSYIAICVTNQPVVARGETTFEELKNIHNKMEDLLGKEGAYLNDLFFCPHHPDKGFPGEVKELKIDCDCRKPKIGMLLKAQKRYNIDFSKSWMIGDTKQDVQTGINAGCQTVLLTCGDPHPEKKFKEAQETFTSSSLYDAISTILNAK
ncbi:MAG: HAD-IIIA family hydrolase [Bacilli bacterium]|jgi:histidinol-phosphate phosphatase family protein|nr:HAD-IIIA family hydrolase [Bacilli bacterium]MCH4229033.1 HAD-IIIA family hydrolase [Bacilli bacterium]MCH4278247.1 HAD-IIIA family hydrolase [Bacilli bacterium]